jgi:hypothetical protein
MVAQKKIISVLLAFIFIAGQVFAGPAGVSGSKLAAPIITDPDINPVRSASIQSDTSPFVLCAT